jgi:hypothetical protein
MGELAEEEEEEEEVVVEEEAGRAEALDAFALGEEEGAQAAGAKSVQGTRLALNNCSRRAAFSAFRRVNSKC